MGLRNASSCPSQSGRRKQVRPKARDPLPSFLCLISCFLYMFGKQGPLVQARTERETRCLHTRIFDGWMDGWKGCGGRVDGWMDGWGPWDAMIHGMEEWMGWRTRTHTHTPHSHLRTHTHPSTPTHPLPPAHPTHPHPPLARAHAPACPPPPSRARPAHARARTHARTPARPPARPPPADRPPARAPSGMAWGRMAPIVGDAGHAGHRGSLAMLAMQPGCCIFVVF